MFESSREAPLPRRVGTAKRRSFVISFVIAICAVGVGLAPSAYSATGWQAVDLAAQTGILAATGDTPTQGYLCVTDANGDGMADIVLSMHGGAQWPLMTQNADGTFTTSYQFAPKDDHHGCVTADFGSVNADGTLGPPDGRPDFYLTTGACQGKCTKPYPNRLYIQQPDGTYAELAQAAGVDDPHGRGREAVAADVNGDGLPDLLVTNEQPSIYTEPNHLYLNTGQGFVEEVDPAVTVPLTSLCAHSADWNGDGLTDLVVCDGKRTYFYQNTGAGFVDVTAQLGLASISAYKDVAFADFNGDGHLDIAGVSQKKFSVRLWHAGDYPYNTINYQFPLQSGSALAIGDLFGTSALDIYVVDGWVSGTARQAPDWVLQWTGGATFTRYQVPQAPDTSATTYPINGQGDAVSIVPNWAGSGRGLAVVSNGKFSHGYYQAIYMQPLS